MDSIGKIFAYCERGPIPPSGATLNRDFNLGFILAAFLALRELAARPASEGKAFRYALVMLVFVIGIGSFLFHTYAEPWARPPMSHRSASSCWPISPMRFTAMSGCRSGHPSALAGFAMRSARECSFNAGAGRSFFPACSRVREHQLPMAARAIFPHWPRCC